MQQITHVYLENEMDVILAHKRSMRLAELAGLSVAGQTTFATAVSEVARNAVEHSDSGQLILGVDFGARDTDKFIIARVLEHMPDSAGRRKEGYRYAQRLVDDISITQSDSESSIELKFRIPHAHRIGPGHVSSWINNFEHDLPDSPYDEIKRKNRQLLNLAEKLRHSEEQYRSLTENVPLHIFRWEPERGLTFTNRWSSSYTGLSHEELTAGAWDAVCDPEDRTLLRPGWEAAGSAGQSFHFQIRLRQAATGDYLWHQGTMIPQRNNLGEIDGWIGCCADIHAQKLIEQTLKDNKQLIALTHELEANQAELQEKIIELNRTNEALERFAYIASHDLQEPLRKIVFYSDYLSRNYAGLYDERGAAFLNQMISATQRMQQLIQGVLSYATIRHEERSAEPVRLDDVVQEVLSALETDIRGQQARFEVGPLPVINGHASQLKQLFRQLIGNALKYARPGVPPEIIISSTYDGKGMAHISVKDNGIGFENQYLDRIFNAFQRLHTREQFEGTGIGLAICRRVAEIHSGHITGSGTPGEGAVFTVSLQSA